MRKRVRRTPPKAIAYARVISIIAIVNNNRNAILWQIYKFIPRQ